MCDAAARDVAGAAEFGATTESDAVSESDDEAAANSALEGVPRCMTNSSICQSVRGSNFKGCIHVPWCSLAFGKHSGENPLFETLILFCFNELLSSELLEVHKSLLVLFVHAVAMLQGLQ